MGAPPTVSAEHVLRITRVHAVQGPAVVADLAVPPSLRRVFLAGDAHAVSVWKPAPDPGLRTFTVFRRDPVRSQISICVAGPGGPRSFAEYLCTVATAGGALLCSAPYGTFGPSHAQLVDRRFVAVAHGSGAIGCAALVDDVLSARPARTLHLIVQPDARTGYPIGDLLSQLAARRPAFSWHAPGAGTTGDDELAGSVGDALDRAAQQFVGGWFVCGPAPWTRRVRDRLHSMGYHRSRVWTPTRTGSAARSRPEPCRI